MEFINQIQNQARQEKKKIVLPEGKDARVLEAVEIIADKEIAEPILLGEESEIKHKASELGVEISDDVEIINSKTFDKLEEYSEAYYQLREHKGISRKEAKEKMKDPIYFASMLVKQGVADGKVAGAATPTPEVLGSAIRIVGTAEGISVISGAFIMVVSNKQFGEDGILVFADAAVNPNPGSEELAEIAISSANTFEDLVGKTARVGMLSFSTRGSTQHELVDKVKDATDLIREKDPELLVDGELQVDAALVPEICKKKCPDSDLGGKANVLVFPDLQSGNIGYKLVQRVAGAEAIGPVLQGMDKPVNDLSRGCSVEDIVNVTAITAVQAQS